MSWLPGWSRSLTNDYSAKLPPCVRSLWPLLLRAPSGLEPLAKPLLLTASHPFLDNPEMRKNSCCLVGALLLMGMCVLPHTVFVISYGRLPLYANSTVIEEGMTKEEVIARLGEPHQKDVHDDSESWYYWTNVFTITGMGVRFSPEGKVENIWI